MSERANITLTTIKKLPPESLVWDAGRSVALARVGRRAATSPMSCSYRTADGRQRWATIGKHGSPWTPDTARAEALIVLAKVKAGGDPAGEKAADRKAATVAELCDAYLDAASTGRLLTKRKIAKKPSTLATDKGAIERHIKPLIGALKVAAVNRRDIENFQNGVAEGKTAARIKTGKHGLARVTGGTGAATRIMGLLGAIFGFAVKCDLRPDNPVSRRPAPCRRPTDPARVRSRICGARQGSAHHAQDRLADRRSRNDAFSLSPAGGEAKCSRSDGQKSILLPGRRDLTTPRPARQCAPCRTRLAMCCALSLE